MWLPLDQSWTIDSPKQHLHDIHGNLKPVHHMIRPSASKCHHSVKSRASSFTPAPSNPRHVPFCFEDNKHETNQQTDKQDKQTRRPPAHTLTHSQASLPRRCTARTERHLCLPGYNPNNQHQCLHEHTRSQIARIWPSQSCTRIQVLMTWKML